MRLHATHTCTIHQEVVIGEDELGGELTETQPVAEAPGRVDTGGTEFITRTTGEFVREAPTIVLALRGTDTDTGDSVDMLDVVEEGNDVQLDGGEERYRIESIDPIRGRGHRLERVALSVQKHT